jgi:MFS family permease
MNGIWTWISPHKTVRMLQLAAFMRSICQGIAVVDLSLYLKELGWSGGAIGGLWVGTGLFRTAVTSFAGELNARMGPKLYMIFFEIITAAAALVITLTGNGIALCSAVIASGIGRGHTGSGGPITPIERSWLGAYARKNASHVFGIHALLGYFGMGIGSLLASLPQLWERWLPGAQQYRPLFAFMVIGTLASIFMTASVNGGRRKAPEGAAENSGTVKPAADKADKKEELAGLVNLVNGIAVTLSSTMTSYWLSAKFAASSGMIGLVMAVSYMTAGAVSLANVYAAKRFGSVNSVICMQAIGIVFVLALPWSPWFWLAAALNVGCTAFHLGARGNQSTVIIAARRERRKRTWRSRTMSFVLRLGTVLWPGAFGSMVENGQFVLPFYMAATVQFGSTLWYGKVHRSQIGADQR